MFGFRGFCRHVDVPGIMQQVKEAFAKKEENVQKPTVPRENISIDHLAEEAEKVIRRYAEEVSRTGKPSIVEINWDMDSESPGRDRAEKQMEVLKGKLAIETGLSIRGYGSYSFHLVWIDKI